MVEQIKSVDYNARQARFVEAAPVPLVEDAIAIVGVDQMVPEAIQQKLRALPHVRYVKVLRF